jgi:hypothetical protein
VKTEKVKKTVRFQIEEESDESVYDPKQAAKYYEQLSKMEKKQKKRKVSNAVIENEIVVIKGDQTKT